MAKVERQLTHEFESLIKDATPGFCLQAFSKGEKKLDLQVGKTWSYYDLASLTKVISTTTLLMDLAGKRKVDINSPVSRYLGYWKGEQRISDFLTHTAGLEWWVPFYQEVGMGIDFQTSRLALRRRLQALKFVDSEKAVYSDPDFWVLGEVVETVLQKPLDDAFEELSDRLKLKDLFYHRDNKPVHRATQYAPTENCPWRQRILQGEVHDENAYAMAGIGAHAGLFGSVDAVSGWVMALRSGLLGQSKALDAKTVHRFTRRAVPTHKGDWALGFMMPSLQNSSAGRRMSLSSVGHTGFVGTSFWWDIKRDWIVVLLSNRVHPTRENAKFVKLRPVIHEKVCEFLDGKND